MPTTPRNPFFNRADIRDPAYFFGRQQVLSDVLSLLANGQSVAVVGSTKIGKSSLLAHIARESTLRDQKLHPDEFRFARLSFGGLEKLEQETFFGLLLDTLISQNRDRISTEWEHGRALAFTDVVWKLDEVTRDGAKVVFLFDEFELSAHNPNFDLGFLAALRSLAGELDVAFVTSTQRYLHEEQLTKQFLGSPFYNILQTVPMGLFTPEEATEMVAALSSRAGVDMAHCAERMQATAGRHPYFLQVLGYYLFDQLSSGAPLDDQVWGTAIRKFTEEAQAHFEAIWSFLWDEEKSGLGRLADDETTSLDAGTTKRLRQLSLVIDDGSGQMKPFSTAFRDFIKTRHTSYPNIVALVQALEAKDLYTRGHSDGVARAAFLIAQELKLDGPTLEELRIAARLHDIGKIGIPDEVLQCKGKLTDSDWDTMRRHPVIGAEIIGALRLPAHVTDYVRGHQERLDGSGYPDGLKAQHLPLGTRILAVADVYNALTTPPRLPGRQVVHPGRRPEDPAGGGGR